MDLPWCDAVVVDRPEAAEPTGCWLVVSYRIPREPSRLRATVWRRIKALGAIYLHNSVAALPDSRDNERALRALRREIIELGGTAQLMRSEILVGANDLMNFYNATRDEEYTEIIDKCNDFLREIEKEINAEHFTYAELEENDEDLKKLKNWFDKVEARDTLGAGDREDALKALAECASALDGFAHHVYLAEDRD